MAVTPFNDNIQVNAPKPLDNKYYLNGLTIYTSTSAANTAIVSAYRYRGLTVAIDVSGTITEYWYFEGTANGDLVVKNLGQVPSARTITGLPTISGGGDLSANRTLAVVDNTNIQKVTSRKNSGANVGSRKRINWVEGTNVTMTVVDDVAADEMVVTINSAAAPSALLPTIYQYAVTTATFTISVLGMIGASRVFPVCVHPNTLFTSTTDAAPASDEAYANTTTGLVTFGSQLQVDQKVTISYMPSA